IRSQTIIQDGPDFRGSTRFGMLFIGMWQMGEATHPLRTHQPFIDLMAQMDHVLLGVLVGAGFTALVQSSSATIGIVIMLATQGHISLEAGIALGIGSKVGTCVTALLSGLGKPAGARRVGVVHVLFNVLGALLWLPFIEQLGSLAASFSPAHPELEGTARLAAETPRQVANAITIFAAVNLAVMIWFTGPIVRLATLLVRDSPVPEPDQIRPKFLDPVFFRTPALAIEQVRLELVHLGTCVERMLEEAPQAVVEGTHEDLDRIVAMDDDVDHLHAEILNYITDLAREELQTSETKSLEGEIEIANNLEAIGDLIETNFVTQGRRRIENKVEFSKEEESAVRPLYREVVRGLRDVLKAVAENDRSLAREVNARKEKVKELANAANEEFSGELFSGDAARVMRFRIESDIVHQISRLFYHVRRIAKTVGEE
ncbi:MAG: Na/Pi symporter, partial [Verrucomicrobiales bacterium]|nr:Na/Pi symporter [Verrucomicrobiales bacterium]